jgi:hypothetical protein
MFRKLTIILLAALTCTVAKSATYYVSKSGSDSNPGTQSSPWLTIQKAANTAQAGDTVNVGTGTYNEQVSLSHSGTSSSPISFNGPATVATFVVNASYVMLTNFAMDFSLSAMTSIPPLNVAGSYDTISGCTMNLAGAYATYINIAGSYNLITKCAASGATTGNSTMVFQFQGNNNTISQSKVSNCDTMDAFRVYSGNYNSVIGNEVTGFTYNNPNGEHPDFIQIYSPNCQYFLADGNFVHDCTIQMGETAGFISPTCNNATFRNNVFANVSGALFIGMPYTRFYNNTFYNCGTWQGAAVIFYWQSNATSDNSEAVNNAFIGPGLSASGGSLSSLNVSHNYTGSSPGFVNASGENLHLTAGSPLIGAGSALSPSFPDKDGVARQGSAWDIGAYAYGVANTNPVISVTPLTVAFSSVLQGKTVTNYITVQNAGAGTLAGTASISGASSGFGIVSGKAYSLSAGQSAQIGISYTPASANDSATLLLTGGGGATVSLSGSLQAVLSGLTFGYVSQSVDVSNAGQAGVTNGGLAVYTFNITNGGNYIVSASVNAPSASSKSFWVNMDSMPTDPTMVWDVYPYTSGFETRTVSWRGTGTPTSDQYNPETFNLTPGVHQLIVVGREAGVQLSTITIVPASQATQPPPPTGLRIVASQ